LPDTLLEGAANALAFEIYVKQVLAPSLQAGQIVEMDNLHAHKGARVRLAIEAKGWQMLLLPGYSPDLSPIEEAKSCAQNSIETGRSPHSRNEASGHWSGPPHNHFRGTLMAGFTMVTISLRMKGRAK
jgi:hypothetical protein